MFFAKIDYQYTDSQGVISPEHELEFLVDAKTQEEAEKLIRDDMILNHPYGIEFLSEEYKVADYVPPNIRDQVESEKIAIVVWLHEELN